MIVNQTTGAFTLTVLNGAGDTGGGVNIPQNSAPIGVLLTQGEAFHNPHIGVWTKRTVFTVSGTFTALATTAFVNVTVVGGGGGGGAIVASTGGAAAGGGGGGGEYNQKKITSGFTGGITVTVGALGGSGASGGNTSFGALLGAIGGAAGGTGTTSSAGGTVGGGAGGAGSAGGDVHVGGQNGDPSYYGSSANAFTVMSGSGGSTPLGSGAPSIGLATNGGIISGGAAKGYGAGGSGGVGINSAGTSQGGNGAAGVCIVDEYA